jgi:hypothetical protein
MVYSSETFNSFLKTYVQNESHAKFIEQQLINMHANCFGTTGWNPYTNMGVIIDIDEKTSEIKGFLNVVESKGNKNNAEIYNVCVNPRYRNQGILGNLLKALPDTYYYYLQVLFENKVAYSAYLKYFFCDFVGIGKLSYGGNVSFILGGRVNTQCSIMKKKQWVDQLDSIAAQIQKINTKYNSTFDPFFEHYIQNRDTYDFIIQNRELISKIYNMNTDKIILSDDVLETLRFPGIISGMNPLFSVDPVVLKLINIYVDVLLVY